MSIAIIGHAVATIQRLAPPALPRVELPALPAIGAADPLAAMSGGSAAALQRVHQSLGEDEDQVHRVMAQGERLVQEALGDIAGIAAGLLREAIVPGLQLLVPNPAVRAAAVAQLQMLAFTFIQRALARVMELASDMTAAAAPLQQVASRAVESVTADGQAPLRELQATPGAGSAGAGSAAPGTQAEFVAAGMMGGSSGEAASGGAGAQAVAAAKAQIGTPYAWGGTGNGGFDCSGLTQYAWRQAGVELPRLAQEQTVGRQVSADELQQGDLVVWDGHVAMYAGGGQIVEAGDPVQTNPLRTTNMGMAFKGFWRPTG